LVAILEETGARASAEDRASGIVEEALAAASAVVPDAGMGLLNELGQWALSGSR
jgi:hypothetical protein